MKFNKELKHELLALAIDTAKQAGQLILSYDHSKLNVTCKNNAPSKASEILTEADTKSQELIIKKLSPSIRQYNFGLLAEECSDDESRLVKEYFWCIDPLDGTLPFTEGKDGYSVSIALVKKNGESQLAVVYDPRNNKLFTAIKGEGALMNGERIKIKQEGETLFSIQDRSLAKDSKHEQLQLIFKDFIEKNKINKMKFIKHGGAAMNTCWVSIHTYSCYVKFPKETQGGGSIWDFAAGSLIASEAGCTVTDFYGQDLNLNNTETTFMNKGGILIASHTCVWDHIYEQCQKFR